MRTVRIYAADGRMASSTTMAEKRVGEAKVWCVCGVKRVSGVVSNVKVVVCVWCEAR